MYRLHRGQRVCEGSWEGSGSGAESTFTSEVEDSKEENKWGEGKQVRGLGPFSGPTGLGGTGKRIG